MSDNVLLQNIEILREKFKISYREAKEALDVNNNDVIEALIFLEDKYGEIGSCPFSFYISCVKNKLCKLYEKGSKCRILISIKKNVVADIPLTAAVISSFAIIIYPIFALVEVGFILLLDIDFKIIDERGEIYDVNNTVKSKIGQVFTMSKDKIGNVISNDMKFSIIDMKARATEFGKKAIDNINDIIENKISKSISNRVSDYAKFVYDVDKDEVNQEYNFYHNGDSNLTDDVITKSENEITKEDPVNEFKDDIAD